MNPGTFFRKRLLSKQDHLFRTGLLDGAHESLRTPVKKSAATISSQRRVRNAFQVVVRLRAGGRLNSVPLENLSDRTIGNLV